MSSPTGPHNCFYLAASPHIRRKANITAPTPTQNDLVRRQQWPAWRLTNGIKLASEEELEASVESCENWALAFAGVLLVGILGEIVSPVLPSNLSHSAVTWWLIGSNALVFVGVAGEVRLGRMGSRRQGELLQRSKDRLAQVELDNGFTESKLEKATTELAEAQRKLAETEKRAGVLEWRSAHMDKEAQQMRLKAAEAEAALIRLSNPRVPNRDEFLKLSEQSKPLKIDVVYSQDGADCSTLATWVAHWLREAGWPVDPPYPSVLPPSPVPEWTATQAAGGQPWGVTILANDLERGSGPAYALFGAFIKGLPKELVCTSRYEKLPEGHLRIVVGPRA